MTETLTPPSSSSVSAGPPVRGWVLLAALILFAVLVFAAAGLAWAGVAISIALMAGRVHRADPVVTMTGQTLAYLPSPTHSVWDLGPLPIHAYALCIVAGIAVALRIAANRWHTAGGREGDLWDVSGWAIVFGIIGGRLYHVISDPELYFKHDEHPLNALKIWDGGLGNWGAVALGGLGAWIDQVPELHDHRMQRDLLTVVLDPAAVPLKLGLQGILIGWQPSGSASHIHGI